MPLSTVPVSEMALSSLEELQEWSKTTQQNLQRIPILGVLQKGAEFLDDEYLGDGETLFKFNEHGLRVFCQRLGLRYDMFNLLETPLLASQVLNDLIRQSSIQAKLENEQFVFDVNTDTIIGIVSNTYVTYSNEMAINDIKAFLNSLPSEDHYCFHSAYGINTEMTIRFLSEKKHGVIKGRGGQGEDKSRLGLDFKNSMVGTSSLQINYFLHRLSCANGLMIPADSAINKVFHSGNNESFKDRMNARFNEVNRKIDKINSLLNTLGNQEFDPDKLAADNRVVEQIFEIIPASKQTICDKERIYLRYPRDCSESDKRNIRIQHDSHIISRIPSHFGGEHGGRIFDSHWRDNASIFDFINVFTEYAKELPPSKRIQTEEKTGVLAKYIANNSQKF